MKELPFYDEQKITRINNAFSGYARTYKIEIIDKKFKYQITLALLLSKVKNSNETKYSSVNFNCLTKTVINSNEFKLDDCFSEIIYRKLDNSWKWLDW